jgi:hypothetical protein
MIILTLPPFCLLPAQYTHIVLLADGNLCFGLGWILDFQFGWMFGNLIGYLIWSDLI